MTIKNKKTYLLIYLSAYLLISLFAADFALAQIKFQPQVSLPGFMNVGDIKNISGTTLGEFIIAFYKWSIGTIAFLAVVMIMIAGFRWMTAAGSAPQITQAKDRINSALIGLILAIGAYSLLSFLNPALVRFKNLNITNINNIELGITWCRDIYNNSLMNHLPEENVVEYGQVNIDKTINGKTQLIGQVLDKPCAQRFQVVQEENGVWKAAGNSCWTDFCEGDNSCYRQSSDNSFICTDPIKLCEGKPSTSDATCALYLKDVGWGTLYDKSRHVCAYEPKGLNNCILDTLFNCPNPKEGDKKYERVNCSASKDAANNSACWLKGDEKPQVTEGKRCADVDKTPQPTWSKDGICCHEVGTLFNDSKNYVMCYTIQPKQLRCEKYSWDALPGKKREIIFSSSCAEGEQPGVNISGDCNTAWTWFRP
ncbi:MAG: pilin [Patescibacteria group bacterium]|nr:pilin [Patescibacteria group bacterium]MDD5164568.1 pilin [Patescibacteria group bacterium]MDD5534307.1 pilin [Patescibacteria group bacterium]